MNDLFVILAISITVSCLFQHLLAELSYLSGWFALIREGSKPDAVQTYRESEVCL